MPATTAELEAAINEVETAKDALYAKHAAETDDDRRLAIGREIGELVRRRAALRRQLSPPQPTGLTFAQWLDLAD